MSARQQRIQILYEIALAIEPGESLESTVDTALSAYLQKLNCSVGGVFKTAADGSYEPVGIRPDAASDDELFVAAERRLDAWANDETESLPLAGETAVGSYYLFSLPAFGVLLLGTRGAELDEPTRRSLEPLNEKLSTACRTKEVESQLREERNRFEAIFTTIQEPVVNVAVVDGTPVIKRANDPFVTTFGPTESRTELIEPTSPADGEQSAAESITERLANGEPVTEEVRRETADGVGDFLLRAVPVRVVDGQEFFLIYVDITAEKRRQRKLESFYREVQTVLTSEDRTTACERTVETARAIVDGSVAEIHLYDRAVDRLIPTASTADEPVFGSGEETLLAGTYDGDPQRLDSIEAAAGSLPTSGRAIESVLLLPLGDHGVLAIGSETEAAFSETAFQFGRLVAALAEIALNRAQRTQSLETLQEVTQDAVTSETREEMVELVVDQLTKGLNLPLTGIWEYDGARERLEPIGATEPARELLGSHPTFEKGDGIAWEAFESGETKVVSDVADHPAAYNEESPIRSEVITPIGEFGLLIAGATRPQNFTDLDSSIAETLASNLETSIQLLESRQEFELLDQVLARVLRHNIRTDLNIIKGYAKALQDETDDDNTFLTKIISHCESLERTAENARTMQQVFERRDARETIAVDRVVADAVEQLYERFPDADVRIDCRTDASVLAHPNLVTAVYHLLENSIEHAVDEATGADHVRVRSARAGDDILLAVEDDGDGIPMDELEVLEYHGESALEHGSGVGLWLVDRIVEYSDGTVEFDVEPGTTVRIYLEPAD